MTVSMTVPMIVAIATLRQSACARASLTGQYTVARRAMTLARRPVPVARAPMNDARHCGRLRAAACFSHQVQDQQPMLQHHAMTDHAMID